MRLVEGRKLAFVSDCIHNEVEGREHTAKKPELRTLHAFTFEPTKYHMLIVPLDQPMSGFSYEGARRTLTGRTQKSRLMWAIQTQSD